MNLGSLNGLTTDTGDIDITAANSAAGDMTATSVTAGGDGNVLLITENGSSDTNDISVGSITAADDDVSLVADAAITDADATTAVDITSNALYLQTGTSVGVDVAGQYLDTRVATIDDYTGGTVGTNLYIREYDGVTLGSLNSTTGLSTTDGEIKITAANSDAGALTASVLTAGGSNNDIYLTTADGGSDTNDIAMGLVTAADDDVWLDSDYDITDADADSASDVVASGLYLDALHSVGASGSSQELDTTVATIDDYSSTRNVTEDIYIIETDAVTLGSINSLTTDNGLIDIDAGGTITVNVVTANTAVHLYATAGDILDNTTGTTLITAGADSSLKASGVIGSAVGPHDPVDVDIDGELWVGADSEENEVSAILQGTVNTSASTERVEIYKPSPPGLVIFDNHLMGGGNYGSGSTGGSILSQGYGTTTVALTTMFDVYPQSALQGWGYPISQGALINEDLLTGPSAGIDGSELGITGIPNNLIIPVHETSMPQFYIIRAP